MKRPKNRLIPLLILLLLGMAVISGWAYLQMLESQSAMARAEEDLADCRMIASRVAILRQRPAMAGSEELHSNELARTIETAAASAQIAPEALAKISPQDGHRVAETVYFEKPTQVLLRQVTLRQLVTFLHGLTTSSGLHIKSLRLSAPREQEAGDRWTVDAALSYLIYVPRTGTDGRLTNGSEP